MVATAGGYLMVVHDLDLLSVGADLHGFKPNMYRLMQMSHSPIRQVWNACNIAQHLSILSLLTSSSLLFSSLLFSSLLFSSLLFFSLLLVFPLFASPVSLSPQIRSSAVSPQFLPYAFPRVPFPTSIHLFSFLSKKEMMFIVKFCANAETIKRILEEKHGIGSSLRHLI